MKKKEFESLPLTGSHKLRLAQAILQYGAGAMVDFTDQTLLTAAPYTWKAKEYDDKEDSNRIDDIRFAKALNVECFEAPQKLQYVQFPEWYFCPVCRRFQPLSKWMEEAEPNMSNRFRRRAYGRRREKKAFIPKCSQKRCKGSPLIPARVVVACSHGHLDDFPWIEWVHYCRVDKGPKKICDHPELYFETGSGTENGEDIRITCRNCHAVSVLKGVFAADAFKKANAQLGIDVFHCTGRLPDFGRTGEPCNETPRALLRGSAAVHISMVRSSLVIPPNIESKAADIDDLRYRWEEYQALCNDETNDDDCNLWGGERPEFHHVKNIDVADYQKQVDLHLSQVALIDRVRIVRALLGYSRLRPVDKRDDPGFVSVKLPQERRYPAYQVYGEGIFLRFKEEDISDWREHVPKVNARAALVQQHRQSKYPKSEKEPITAKFLLLHTLAHLLIKELSFECGYNAAGLAERIYCADEETDGFDMAGIFIYAANGDAEGTLGGLVRQGRADTLPQIFHRALTKAKFCSNDPLCGDSQGQGQGGQNLAACHACALLPETSCEMFNSCLDRGVVVGTFREPEIGFFSHWQKK